MTRQRWITGAGVLLFAAALLYIALRWDDLGESRDAAGLPGRLTIYSTTDLSEFAPVIEDFRQIHPDIAIEYLDLDAMPLYERFLAEEARNEPRADLLLSSAMDLQVKLVNDGYAATHHSENSLALPEWARWREEAFGFTFEPAVLVFNTSLLAERPLPQSRDELLDALRDDPSFWRSRIGTYDIGTSSVGYLIASQDARLNGNFSALLKAFGDVDVQVADNTATILERLRTGKLKAGYNLLGSYARRVVAAGAPLAIVYPRDYTLAVLRTAVIPRNAPHPAAARQFLDYLLSIRGQRILETRTGLSAIRDEVAEGGRRFELASAAAGTLRPIALGPGLLVYLDDVKRRRLLENWSNLARRTEVSGRVP